MKNYCYDYDYDYDYKLTKLAMMIQDQDQSYTRVHYYPGVCDVNVTIVLINACSIGKRFLPSETFGHFPRGLIRTKVE